MPGDQHRDKLGALLSVRVMPTPMLRLGDRVGVREVIEALKADRWAPGARFVKRDRGRWVWLGDLRTASGGVGLVIKGRARSGLGVAGLMPDRHAIKQAVGADRLRAIDVATSEPIALLDVRSNAGGRERWLVLRALRGETLAQVLTKRERSFGEDAELAHRVGALVRTLCDAGLFNRDHKASNLIVMETGVVGVVDTVAIRRRRPGAMARRRMLLAMCKELTGIGAMPRRAQLMRCLRTASDEAHADWRSIAVTLRQAGDTTPSADPLSAGEREPASIPK